jgi:hypothetical protein
MNTKTAQTPDLDRSGAVFFEIYKTHDEVRYVAKHRDLEISGTTGDTVFYRETVERIVSASRDPPDDVYKMADLIVRHVTAAVEELGADYVTAGVATEVASGSKLGVNVYLTYIHDDDVWRGAVETKFDGRDGRHSESVHVVKKRVEFADIDAEALRREIIRVAKHAYNAYSKW